MGEHTLRVKREQRLRRVGRPVQSALGKVVGLVSISVGSEASDGPIVGESADDCSLLWGNFLYYLPTIPILKHMSRRM